MLSEEVLRDVIDTFCFVPDDSTIILTPPAEHLVQTCLAMSEASQSEGFRVRKISFLIFSREIFAGVIKGDKQKLQNAAELLSAMLRDSAEATTREVVMTRPIVGQRAQFYPPVNNVWRSAAPLAGIVTQVFNERHVGLAVFKPDGTPMQSPPEQVVVCGVDDERPDSQPCCVLLAENTPMAAVTADEKCEDCGGDGPEQPTEPTPVTTMANMDEVFPPGEPASVGETPIPAEATTDAPVDLDPTGTTQINPPTPDA